jgi:hypothetical protein
MPQGPNPEANAISDNPYHRADGQLTRVRLTRLVSSCCLALGRNQSWPSTGSPSTWSPWMSAQIYKTTREQGCRRGSKTGIRPAIAYNSIAWLITSSRPEVYFFSLNVLTAQSRAFFPNFMRSSGLLSKYSIFSASCSTLPDS